MSCEVERRTNLSYEEFASQYLYPNKPVIVTDGLRDWPALTRWTPEFFKREFGDMKVVINDSYLRGLPDGNGGTVEYTMAQFVDRVLASSDDNPAPYFRNCALYSVFPSLKRDIEPLPEYLYPNWLPNHYMLKPVRAALNGDATIQIYIGGRGGTFPVLHYDVHAIHAFLMQIYGQKRFTLYPPEQSQFLYPSPTKQNRSLLNSVENPDLKKFPLFAKAVPVEFVLEPGEFVFIPSRWWHTTKMLTPCISVSVNVVNQSNWHDLIEYFCAASHNPVMSAVGRTYLNGAGAWRSRRDRRWQLRAQ